MLSYISIIKLNSIFHKYFVIIPNSKLEKKINIFLIKNIITY